MESALRQDLAGDIGRRGDLLPVGRVGRGAAERGLHSCPTCRRPWPVVDNYRPLTERELDALSAWWHYRSVQLAAKLIGVGEQRAKNLLASVRAKAGVASNLEAVDRYFGLIRGKHELMSHNVSTAEEE